MGILDGIKVLELGSYIMAPATCAILGEMGAEVIKIEEPGGGDPSRGLSIGPVQISPLFMLENRNKKSFAVDMTTEDGQKIVHQMIETADVLVTNMSEEVLARLGMQYATLSQINPRLIFASASAYGPKGPEAKRRNFDVSAFWTRGGFMSYLGEPDSAPPAQAAGAFGDHTASVHLALGVISALYHRERTGEGQRVNVSLLGTGIWTAAVPVQIALLLGFSLPRAGRKGALNPLYNNYKSRDGMWFMLALLQSDRHWPDLCCAVDREDLIDDPRFLSQDKRMENAGELVSTLDAIFSTKTMEEWAECFEKNNILFWDQARDYAEIATDPQALANDYIVDVKRDDSGENPVKLVAFPVQFTKSKGGIKSAAPELGQHTEELLLEIGYSWEDITDLKDREVIL
ncbi:MAG: CoA transferase [Thermodesulfobacteriota bacterium]|nr:CoA transferase [Thermodesulfobacteriota bacterium]